MMEAKEIYLLAQLMMKLAAILDWDIMLMLLKTVKMKMMILILKVRMIEIHKRFNSKGEKE